MTNEANRYKESLIKNKVIALSADNSINKVDSRLDSKITAQDVDTFLTNFMLNDYLVRSSFSLLTVGDPAFYKADNSGNKLVDYTKRAKEIMSPKKIGNIQAVFYPKDGSKPIEVSSSYRTFYLKDEEKIAPNYDAISAAVDAGVASGLVSKSAATVIKASYKVINQTDAQAYISLPFYRETMISLGRWTDKHQEAYPRLEKGEGTANDIVLFMQPNKPFVYTQIYDRAIKRMVPTQNKNSEYLLLPQMFKDGNYDTWVQYRLYMITSSLNKF
jgi:hypothetical protein